MLGTLYLSNEQPAEAGGIVGVVGGDDAVGFLLEGLTILRNRGYDSAGVASVGVRSDSVVGTDLVVTKYASRDSTCDSIDLVRAHASKHIGWLHQSTITLLATAIEPGRKLGQNLVSYNFFTECFSV